MKLTNRLFGLVILSSFIAAACSGSSGSGVDSSKPVSELSDEDISQMCEWGDALVADVEDELIKVACYFGAWFFAPEDECEMAAQECIEDPGEDESSCTIGEDQPECAADVTVGELETCLEAIVAQLTDFASTVSCDSDFEVLFSYPPGCAPVEEKCPELI